MEKERKNKDIIQNDIIRKKVKNFWGNEMEMIRLI